MYIHIYIYMSVLYVCVCDMYVCMYMLMCLYVVGLSRDVEDFNGPLSQCAGGQGLPWAHLQRHGGAPLGPRSASLWLQRPWGLGTWASHGASLLKPLKSVFKTSFLDDF